MSSCLIKNIHIDYCVYLCNFFDIVESLAIDHQHDCSVHWSASLDLHMYDWCYFETFKLKWLVVMPLVR